MKPITVGCCTLAAFFILVSMVEAQPAGGSSSNEQHAQLKRQADTAYRERNYAKTVDLTSRVIAENSNDGVAYYLRGSARVELGIAARDAKLIREGVEDARRAIQSDGSQRADFYLPYLYGMSHLTVLEGDRAHAEMAVKVATEVAARENMINSTKSNLLYQRALAHSKLENYRLATDDLRATLELDPRHLAAHLALADALTRNGDAKEAAAAFSAAAEQFPSSALVFNNRGMFYQTQKQNEDAIADFTTAISLENNHLQAHLNRGFTLLNTGDHLAAESDFSRAIEIKPDHAPAYALRATSELLQHKTSAALQDYLKVIELRPSYAPARADIAFAYFFAGHYGTAADAFKQAITLAPESKYLVPWRYAAMSLAGQEDAAQRDYGSIAKKPSEKRDWFDVLTLFFMGQLEEREVLTSIDSQDAKLRDAQLCEAYYFIGLRLQRDGQGDPERYFRRAVQAQSKQLSAFRAAQLALEQMQQ